MTHNVLEHVCELFIPMLYIAYIRGELIARKFLLGCEKMNEYVLSALSLYCSRTLYII